MTCQRVSTQGAGTAIVCDRGRGPARRCACGRPATLLCDWRMPDRRTGTCDAPLCASCSTSPAPDKDLCPAHAAAWAERSGRTFDLFTPPRRDQADTPLSPGQVPAASDSAPSNEEPKPETVAECSPTVALVPAEPEPQLIPPKPRGPVPSVASVATVAELRTALAFLAKLERPEGIGQTRWKRLKRDLALFNKHWLEQAVALGWTSHDLFGCWRDPLAGRTDCDGLVYGLDGRPIESMDERCAVIVPSKHTASRWRRYRAGQTPGVKMTPEAMEAARGALCWEALAAMPAAPVYA